MNVSYLKGLLSELNKIVDAKLFIYFINFFLLSVEAFLQYSYEIFLFIYFIKIFY